MDRVLLVNRNSKCEFLFNTKRKYRNVRLTSSLTRAGQRESLVRLLLRTIKLHVRMLDFECNVSSEQLGSILLKAPELQHLSIGYNLDKKYCRTRGPFRVFQELMRLNRRQLSSFFRTNIPNLQCLQMNCRTDVELDAWKILSGQLKLVRVKYLAGKFFEPFLKLTFPLVEDFTLALLPSYWYTELQETMSSLGDGFFGKHSFLQRISTCMHMPVEWVESITNHCPELTHLHLSLNYPNEGLLESLVQLRKLNHLSLEGHVYKKILRGVMTSLESVELKMFPSRVLLENFFEVVPRLGCLKIKSFISCDEAQFICEKFSCLRRLEVSFGLEFLSVADDSVRFDRLVHLQELNVTGNIKIRMIHRNNVRYLTLSRCSVISFTTITEDDLNQIPEKFPLLNRLILERCSVSVSIVERLHKLMPSCRIDYGKKRFYPIDDMTAD